MKNRKNILTFGLITALGIGGVFTFSKNNSFADTNAGLSLENSGYTEDMTQEEIDQIENGTKYIYKDGKLEKYNETKANKEDSIMIITDDFNEGDEVDIRFE